MVGPARSFRSVLVLAIVIAVASCAAPAAHASEVPATTDTGALRAGQVLVRRALPWILAFVEELLDQLKGPAPAPPPTPPTPPIEPPIEDPDYTP